MFQHVQKCLRIVTIHIILNLNKFRHVLTIIQKNLENLEDLENLKNLDNWELTFSFRIILSSDLGLDSFESCFWKFFIFKILHIEPFNHTTKSDCFYFFSTNKGSSVIKTGRSESSLLPYFYLFPYHYPLIIYQKRYNYRVSNCLLVASRALGISTFWPLYFDVYI